MGIGKVIRMGLSMYAINEMMKKRKAKKGGNYNPYQQEMDRQDKYEYDCYVYGEEDSF